MGLCHRGGVSASEMGARLLNARYLNCLLPRHVAVRACCLTYLVIVYDGGPRGHLAEARSLIVATLSPVVWDAPQMVYVTMAELSPMFYLMFSGFQLIPGSYPTHTRLIPWRGLGQGKLQGPRGIVKFSPRATVYLLVHFDCYVIVLFVYPSYGPPGGADLQAFVGVCWGTNFAPKAANRWKKK